MKVLFFANSDWYLYNFRISLARHLAQHGHEVVMVSPRGEYTESIRKAGFRWLPVDMGRRSTNPLGEIGNIIAIRRILDAEKPAILHNFTIKSVVYGSIAARSCGLGHVVNAVAGLGYVFSNQGLHARLLRPVVRRLLRFAMSAQGSRLILQNPDDEELFIRERLAHSGNIRLILGSGVDTTRFDAIDRRQRDIPRVLLASRLLWDKGVGDYVEAARIVKQAGHRVEFVLAGSTDAGNPASVSDADIEAWRQQGDVVPVGHLDGMDEYLRSTDVVVLPTRYGEGVPRSLIEAAASGIPLVATDVPGCREIVRHGVNGYLVQPADARGLADAIMRLLSDAEHRHSLGLNGRQIVLDEFDEKVVFEQTMKVYQEMVPHRDAVPADEVKRVER